MLYYNLTYLIPAIVVVLSLNNNSKIYRIIELLFLLLLVVLIGLRYQIGGDWIWYLKSFKLFGEINFSEFNYTYNYGYIVINWIIYNLGLSYYFVKLFCAFILVISIYYFFKSFKVDRLLAYCIFFPLGIVVISMGFVRQGCAMSFLMLALTFLNENKYFRSYLFLLIGLSFHKSILIFFPIIFLVAPKYRIIITIVIIIFIYYFQNHLFHLVSIYLGPEKGIHYDVSKGGYVRILMTLIPAVLYLIYHNLFDLHKTSKKIFFYLSVFIILSSILSIFYPTFIDRILLYLVFFQAIIYSLFSEIFSGRKKIYIKCLFILSYLFILNFFLTFGFHSKFWIPYKNLLLTL